MTIFKSIAVAFSLYSAIPMPQFEWKEEDMRYSGCFFALVGLIIGAVIYVWWCLCMRLGIPQSAQILVATAIPIIITGGFHIDGYMDVCDAIKSYGSIEKRLDILKDPHIGAFSVICLAKTGLIYMAALACIFAAEDEKLIVELGMSYILSRILSMITMKCLKLAKKDGMLSDEAGFSNRKMLIIVIVELVVAASIMIYISPVLGLALLATAVVVTVVYRYFAYSRFGGITGDTAGYYVVINECAMAVALAILGLVG